MLPTEASVVNSIASVITSTTTYTILVLLTAFLIYFFKVLDFFELPSSYKMLLALVLPMFLWEFVLGFLFGMVGIHLDWGSYVYHFPYFGDIVTKSGVMISRFLDFTFNFGPFREFGLPYFNNFVNTTQIPVTVIPPDMGAWGIIKSIFASGFNFFVWVWVSADSILDYIFFFILFSAILAVLAENMENQKAWAAGLALVPVILYSYFISNPFQEYPEALVMLEKIFYFWGHGDSWSLTVFFLTLIVSFIIVMEIIAMVVHIVLKGGAMTIQPSWQSKEWEISQHGIAFGYALAFAAMYSLHPEWSWYSFYPMLILYTLLKKVGGVAVDTSHAYREKQEFKDLLAGVGNNDQLSIKSNNKSNSMEYIMYVALGILILVLLLNMGII